MLNIVVRSDLAMLTNDLTFCWIYFLNSTSRAHSHRNPKGSCRADEAFAICKLLALAILSLLTWCWQSQGSLVFSLNHFLLQKFFTFIFFVLSPLFLLRFADVQDCSGSFHAFIVPIPHPSPEC